MADPAEQNDPRKEDDSSDDDKPQDEFTFFYQIYKNEDRKIYNHSTFEAVVAKYWRLLKKCERGSIGFQEYQALLHRIYKALLPLYVAEDATAEIKDEWIFDSRSNDRIKFTLFAKFIFRIAHWWCVDVDLEQYIDFLEKLFARITCKYHVTAKGRTQILPKIEVGFPIDEKMSKDSGEDEQRVEYEDPWVLCGSDSSNKSDYEYKYEEEPENMQIKKFKRPKTRGKGESATSAVRDPFYYEEKLVYFEGDDAALNDPSHLIIEDWLEVKYIIPIGFPTEQYLTELKNEVFKLMQADRSEEALNMATEGKTIVKEFKLTVDKTNAHLGDYKSHALLTDTVLDGIRKKIRDGTEVLLRFYSPFPRLQNSRLKSPSLIDNPDEPVTEINKYGVNPAMERRVFWEFIRLPNATHSQYINVNYIQDNMHIKQYITANIKSIENKQFLILKEVEIQRRDEDFTNDTPYKRVRQIMLNRKFETIFQDRCKMEEKEQKRMRKQQKRDLNNKKNQQKLGYSQKTVMDSVEDKAVMAKITRGPFYQSESKIGIYNDPVVSDIDVIEHANKPCLSILVLGKPRSGKSTTCGNLAQTLDLVHIHVQRFIDLTLKKVEEHEPAEDLEEGQEEPEFLTLTERAVVNALKDGVDFTDEMMIAIYNDQIQSDEAQVKGFVLDLPYYTTRKESWAQSIRTRKLVTPEQGFSFIVEIGMDDNDIKLRSKNMRIDPEDGKEFSRWERQERKKPKPKRKRGEDSEEEEEEEEEEDDENKPKIFDEDQLVMNPAQDEQYLLDLLAHYNNTESPAFEEMIVRLYNYQYIKLEAAGLTPTQIQESLVARIKGDYQLRPIARPLEGEGDAKALLTQGFEDEKEVSRSWSLWNQTDPVSLFEGKVIPGVPDFAADYNHKVFLFSSEENQKAFLSNPKKYLVKAPEMPKEHRILIAGPASCGKKTQAQRLSEKYGWKIIDYLEIVNQRIKEQLEEPYHSVNNPLSGMKIGLSDEEVQSFKDGKPFDVDKLVPLIYQHLGLPLEKKRPPPPKPKEEGEEEEEEAPAPPPPAPKKPDPKKKDARPASKAQSRKGSEDGDQEEEEEEKEPPLDDLNIDDIDLMVEDEETLKKPFVGGFILLGYPETDEQLTKLKEAGIDFDRVLLFVDGDEENPGQLIKDRKLKQGDLLYDYDADMENVNRISGFLKEQLGDEIVKEIQYNGNEQDVFYRILPTLDPFYIQVDSPDNVKTSAELDEESKPLTKGEYGDFCPMTFLKESWLFPGSIEAEALVKGRTYRFAGEKELEEFKIDPMKHIYEGFKQPPNPHFMVIGCRGAGVSTQIKMLCDRFKLDEFEIKDNFLKKLEECKEKRKRDRLLKRGFKAPPPQEEWEDENTPPPDPEIDDDPEEFDRQAHEVDCLKEVMRADRPCVFDLNWFDLPEEAVATTILELFQESRRLPEVLIVLNTQEAKIMDRIMDVDVIKAEYERLVEKRNQEKKEARDTEREEKLAALKEDAEKPEEEIEAEMKEWEEAKAAEDEEEDPEAPNYENMLNEEKEKLHERFEKDKEFLDEFVEGIKGKLVPVLEFNGDQTPQQIFRRVTHQMVQFIERRKNMIERYMCLDLKPEDVPYFEKVYKVSKFGFNSPVFQSNPYKTRENAAIYRDRIFYFSNPDEKQRFLNEPYNFASQEPVPTDVQFNVKALILGLPKSGKSTMAQRLVQQIGIIHLRISEIIKAAVEEDSCLGDSLREKLGYGVQVDDEILVQLVAKRVQQKDCFEKGFILEGFPNNRFQANLLTRKSVVPNLVFYVDVSENTLLSRTESDSGTKFGYERTIFRQRIQKFNENIGEVTALYEKFYNNLVRIDGVKSKWFMESKGLQYMESSLKQRMEFSREYSKVSDKNPVPCRLDHITIDQSIYKHNLSNYKFFCPVTWKNNKLLRTAKYQNHNIIFYAQKFYYFLTETERELFVENPKRFTHKVHFPADKLPWHMKPQKSCEIAGQDKNLSSYCPVTLIETDKLAKGDASLVVQLGDLRFCFAGFEQLRKFQANPFKYQKASLPVKMPPPQDPVQLSQLVEMPNSIPFLEQALGQVITRALMEIGCNRIKYPEISVRETALKFFSIFLKANNPSNAPAIKAKYQRKLKEFVKKCNLPCEIYKLSQQLKSGGGLPAFKENHYHSLGADYDKTLKIIDQEKRENFMNLIR